VRDVSLAFLVAGENQLVRIEQLGELQAAQPDGEENTGSNQQNEHRWPPYQTANPIEQFHNPSFLLLGKSHTADSLTRLQPSDKRLSRFSTLVDHTRQGNFFSDTFPIQFE
jgi:hypothetical protein